MGKRIRLKQEFLLVSASIQDIIMHYLKNHPDLSAFGDKVRIQINDTHPSLVIAELMRLLTKQYDFGWHEAWETVQTVCSYSNHTILQESLEEWNQNRLDYLLPRQYKIIQQLNLELCNSVRAQYPGDEERVRRMSCIENGQCRMANFAIYGSHKVNGVAALHTEILKKSLFKDFYEMYPDRFVNVTNGVTQRRWILHANPRLADWICKRIGKGWITHFPEIGKLAHYAKDPVSQQEFLQIKKENKQELIAYLREKNPLRDAQGKVFSHSPSLDEDALFAVQIKRIHEYKRQLMHALHIIMIYHELQANPFSRKVKRMVIFAGKAAPGYAMAKNIIQLISCISRRINLDSAVRNMLKVAFIENYNVTRAEKIIPAADLSEQISTAGTEASGTGNMKLSMNGALTICTEDGSNVEVRQEVTDQFWPFSFGAHSLQNEEAWRRGGYNPWDVYMHNPSIAKAVDALRDRSLAFNDTEHEALCQIYHSLLEKGSSDMADKYFVLNDLPAYYQMQKKVEELYANPSLWAEYAIQNMAGMGKFSSDEAAHNYARLIWDLKPCPMDPQELASVRNVYSEHDKCRIKQCS